MAILRKSNGLVLVQEIEAGNQYILEIASFISLVEEN